MAMERRSRRQGNTLKLVCDEKENSEYNVDLLLHIGINFRISKTRRGHNIGTML